MCDCHNRVSNCKLSEREERDTLFYLMMHQNRMEIEKKDKESAVKHFTQYLYEYKDGKRIRNIGFVKGEFEEDSGRLMMQARGLNEKLDGKIQVFLFYPRGEGFESVYQGTIQRRSILLNDMLSFGREDLGHIGTTEELTGLLLTGESGAHYMAVWNGENVEVDAIREMEEEKETLEKEEKESIAEEEDMRLVQESGDGLEEEVEETSYICEKIQRRDLARLPRKYWYLANNNFLLHGFYTYHYLLWMEEEGILYIGVPGVGHERERQVARVFGFTEFRAAQEVHAKEEEESASEEFGYFFRRIGRINDGK